MRRFATVFVLLLALSTLFLSISQARGASPHEAAGPLVITPVSPAPNSTTGSTTPTIVATFTDHVAPVNPSSVLIFVDRDNVTGVESVTVSAAKITYVPPSILALHNGVNNVSITATDTSGNTATVFWNFTVNTNLTSTGPSLFSTVKPATIVFYIAIAAAIAGAIVGGYILFLKQTTRFTFRRYFATHHVERVYLVVYLPCLVAFLVVLISLDYVYNTPGLPPQAPDWVFILGLFVALTAFGVDSRHEMHRTKAYERAFAQFLFELADAMRGGIDPAKAIVELSKTQSNIMSKQLRIAADGIRLGRPFESVLRDMAVPMNSPLINRYASLIADATGVGGEIAIVVYRAAKDMDDFVKIEEEREKQLLLPVAVIYIAFAVLMAVLFALIYIAPDLGHLNINFLGTNPLSGGAKAAVSVPSLSEATLKERFFELMLINSLGTGAIIGAFTEGRARYGILHSLALVAATAIAFAIVFGT
ncbi:MAG TPA: type II secretion system F family protein [Thermoplasmata archaeon]|nr:type II secretion system F family protein [Thermoplasmata archaeon]